MPRSSTEIVNQALGHLGNTERLTSIEDATNVGALARLYFTDTRDELLRHCEWSFATTFVSVAKFGYTLGDWLYAYAVPKDAVKVRRVFRQQANLDAGVYYRDDQPMRYDLVYDHTSQFEALLTDELVAQIEYTARVEDAAVYDPLFVNALTYMMAAKMAGGLTANMQIQNAMEERAARAISAARTQTKRERNRRPAQRVPWLEARSSNGTSPRVG